MTHAVLDVPSPPTFRWPEGPEGTWGRTNRRARPSKGGSVLSLFSVQLEGTLGVEGFEMRN